jgi:hypothetical protein
MLRDNLAGLIEPMIDRAGAHPLGGHSKHGPTGGCSRSTELTIVVLKRSWRPTFRWKTGRQAEKAKCPCFEVTTAAHDSRAVGTALHQSHRTIDPQCLKKSPPRRGGIYALTKNVPSPFHAEPTQCCLPRITRASASGLTVYGAEYPPRLSSVYASLSTSRHPAQDSTPSGSVGIELRRAGGRCRVTKPALSIASWVHISTVATFPEAPL